jgi:hypothetical protein
MQKFFFAFMGFLVLFFTIHQIFNYRFYTRVERLFLLKKNLTTKKTVNNKVHILFNLEHFLVNMWLILALIEMEYSMMAIFFICMYHSTIFFRKVMALYETGWFIDRVTVLTSCVFILATFFGIKYFKEISWNREILFSISFFLITFTSYILKIIYNYNYAEAWRRFQKIC